MLFVVLEILKTRKNLITKKDKVLLIMLLDKANYQCSSFEGDNMDRMILRSYVSIKMVIL